MNNPLVPMPESTPMVTPVPLSQEAQANLAKVEGLMAGMNKGLKAPVVGTVKNLFNGQPDMEFIPSGIMSVDGILGGGFARKRMYEFYGPEGSGKTTLCMKVLANNQKMSDSVSVLIDAEQAFDVTRASAMDVDIDRLYLSQPDYGEQAIDIAVQLCQSEAVGCIVIDSVAALIPKAEYEGTMETSQQMGHIAAMMGKAMRHLKGACRQGNTCIILINQLREKPGVMFGNPEYTPGGRAVKFTADARVEIRRGALIKSGDIVIGQDVKVKAVKNKLSPPHIPAMAKLYYDERGFDELASVIETALMQGILQRSGAWINVPIDSPDFPEIAGHNIGQGMENARQYTEANPEFKAKLINICTGNILERRKQIIASLSQSVRMGEIDVSREEEEPKKSKKVPAKKKSK